jgi:hypothetical protein
MHSCILIRSPDETFHKMGGKFGNKLSIHFFQDDDFFKADYFRQALIPTQIDSMLLL